MGFNNTRNLMEARIQISEVLSDGDNTVIAVDFRNKLVECVSPVRLNRKGECLNENEIINDLKLFDCHPRKLKKQSLPRLFDTSNVLLFDKIA